MTMDKLVRLLTLMFSVTVRAEPSQGTHSIGMCAVIVMVQTRVNLDNLIGSCYSRIMEKGLQEPRQAAIFPMAVAGTDFLPINLEDISIS